MKRFFLIIIFEMLAASLAMFFSVSHAYAQVAITGQLGMSNSCYPTASSIGVSNPAPILTWSNNKDYAITGNYTLDLPSCNSSQFSGSLHSLCLSVTQALSNAAQIANGISGFPQMTDSGTVTNLIQLSFVNSSCTRGSMSGSASGQQAGMCEGTEYIPRPGGGTSIVATIYVNANSAQSQAQAPYFASNSTFATCTLAHEMSHAFGVADVPNYSGPGLMASECDTSMSANNEETPGNPWDSNTAATIRALNANKSIAINPDTCTVNCPSGQFQRYQKNSSGNYTPFCSTSASVQTDDFQCDCRGTTPTCIDLTTGQPATAGLLNTPYVPPNACQTPDPSTLDCGCSANLNACAAENGDNETDIFNAPASVCSQSSVIPSGETCECINGELINDTCTDINGNSVSPPPGFSCGSSGGSSSGSTGGYSCLNGACVYNAGGGEYPDSSCDDTCNADGF